MNEKVLVVDDEKEISNQMKHFLFGNSSDGPTDKKNTRTD